ncbi:MAG TPA: SDR family oxidoreductase [Pelobium sp.]|nr:SDR family oxidoreductase [Pelobium sp.]
MNSYIKAQYHYQDISKFSFLITGGAGFIGSNLATYLLYHGAKKVRVLDNLATGNLSNIEPLKANPNFELLEGDICDLETCNKAMEGIDYVSHQAALGSVPRSIKDPITTNKVNIDGFLNVLEAAKNAKVKRMIYASSSSIYGDSKILPKVEENIGKPLSPYAITKAVNELYADTFSKHYAFHTIGLRYFNVFGPLQDPNGAYAAVIPLFFTAALNNKPATLNGKGDQTRDFTFIGNVIQANVKAMLVENLTQHEACNIAFGERINLQELWVKINDMLGKSIDPVFGPPRAGDVQDSLADISKAKRVFGYQPEYDLNEGLKESVDFYRV